jgi:hypothetical protein
MKRKLLPLLAAPALMALAPLHAQAQQPLTNDNVVYIWKQYSPAPAGGMPTWSLVLAYNGKQCVLAQGNSPTQMGPPAGGAPAVTVPQATLTNMWNNLTDPQWLPWISPPATVMQQILAL